MENGTDYYWVGHFDEYTNEFTDGRAGGRVNTSVPSQRCARMPHVHARVHVCMYGCSSRCSGRAGEHECMSHATCACPHMPMHIHTSTGVTMATSTRASRLPMSTPTLHACSSAGWACACARASTCSLAGWACACARVGGHVHVRLLIGWVGMCMCTRIHMQTRIRMHACAYMYTCAGGRGGGRAAPGVGGSPNQSITQSPNQPIT